MPGIYGIIPKITYPHWNADPLLSRMTDMLLHHDSYHNVLERLTRSYLAKYGFHNCTVSTVFHQYMAAFPTDIRKARDLMVNSSTTCTLAGATRIMTETPVESIHIPTRQGNAKGLDLRKKGIEQAFDSTFDRNRVQEEMGLL